MVGLFKMEKLDEYNKLKKEIHEYFGYIEDWCIYPIEDSREVYWKLEDDCVNFWNNKENVGKFLDDDGYSHRILNNLPKSIYIKDNYTMIVVDTECDGNKYLQIFDNNKEVK